MKMIASTGSDGSVDAMEAEMLMRAHGTWSSRQASQIWLRNRNILNENCVLTSMKLADEKIYEYAIIKDD